MAGLVDTNVLIYAHDPSDPAKHKRAMDLIGDLALRGELVLSVQVLNEFFVRATLAGRAPGMTAQQARDAIADIRDSAIVLGLTWAATFRAVAGVIKHRLSFWDALIWAVAMEHSMTVIYTEDCPGATEIEGIRYVNPFANPM